VSEGISRNVEEYYRGGSRDKVSATNCNGIIRLSVDNVGNCFSETVNIHFLFGIKLLCVILYVGWISAKHEISRTVLIVCGRLRVCLEAIAQSL
jgi:hypothetical protein